MWNETDETTYKPKAFGGWEALKELHQLAHMLTHRLGIAHSQLAEKNSYDSLYKTNDINFLRREIDDLCNAIEQTLYDLDNNLADNQMENMSLRGGDASPYVERAEEAERQKRVLTKELKDIKDSLEIRRYEFETADKRVAEAIKEKDNAMAQTELMKQANQRLSDQYKWANEAKDKAERVTGQQAVAIAELNQKVEELQEQVAELTKVQKIGEFGTRKLIL